MRIRSARLVGRRLAPDDLEFLHHLHSDPDVMRYIGGVRDRATTEAWLAANLAHWDEHGFGQWVLHERGTDRPIGRGGLRVLDAGIAAQVAAGEGDEDEGEMLIDVGYTLMVEAWGKGLATEATSAFLAVAQSSLGQTDLCAITLEGNDASSRVLEKTGFVFERWVDHDWGPHRFFRWRSRANPASMVP